MLRAARFGHGAIVQLCRKWGAIDVDRAMLRAARFGHEAIVRLCLEWGATDDNADKAIIVAAEEGHEEIVQLCYEWGPPSLIRLMALAAEMTVKRSCGCVTSSIPMPVGQ
jgi:hypothetical protein